MKNKLSDLRIVLDENKLDAVLISNFYNIYYLSGFKTLVNNERESWLLITKKGKYIFSDSRYLTDQHITSGPSRESVNYRLVTPENRLIGQIKKIINDENIKNLGFEADDLRFFEYKSFRDNLKNINLVETTNLIIKLREIKNDEEISKITKSCEITDRCFKEILRLIEVGKSEKEIAYFIENWLKVKGFDLAFYPIIAINDNSAAPHYDTKGGSNKKVKNGSIILVDFGVNHKGYLSDMTRMIYVGKPPTEIIKTYNCLLTAHKKAVSQLDIAIKNGERQNSYKLIDSAARNTLTESGLKSYPHSTGHGVGLEIHEYPKVSHISLDVIVPGQVITIEPGVYHSKKWGMRIEDTILINKGGALSLTHCDRNLFII